MTQPDKDECREAFEAWFNQPHYDMEIDPLWECWQAAWNTRPAPVVMDEGKLVEVIYGAIPLEVKPDLATKAAENIVTALRPYLRTTPPEPAEAQPDVEREVALAIGNADADFHGMGEREPFSSEYMKKLRVPAKAAIAAMGECGQPASGRRTPNLSTLSNPEQNVESAPVTNLAPTTLSDEIAHADMMAAVVQAFANVADSNPHCSIGHLVEHGAGTNKARQALAAYDKRRGK